MCMCGGGGRVFCGGGNQCGGVGAGLLCMLMCRLLGAAASAAAECVDVDSPLCPAPVDADIVCSLLCMLLVAVGVTCLCGMLQPGVLSVAGCTAVLFCTGVMWLKDSFPQPSARASVVSSLLGCATHSMCLLPAGMPCWYEHHGSCSRTAQLQQSSHAPAGPP